MARRAFGLFIAMTLAGVTFAAPVRASCIEAADAVAQGELARAERLLRRLLDDPKCRYLAVELQFTLAGVLEAGSTPPRACEAKRIYAALVGSAGEAHLTRAAEAGLARATLQCEAAQPPRRAPDEPAEAAATAPVEVSRTDWWLVGSAIVAASSLTVGLATLLHAERADDLRRLSEAQLSEAERSSPEYDFLLYRVRLETTRATRSKIAGWTLATVGVGAGLLALIRAVEDSGQASPTDIALGPSGVIVRVAF